MDNSTNLGLPYIMAAQAQKLLTHNEGVRMLDAVVQLAVLNRVTFAPPSPPTEGDRYIVPSAATGDRSDRSHKIVAGLRSR